MKKKIIAGCSLICLAAVLVVFAASLWAVYHVSQKAVKENLVSETAVYADLLADGYGALAGVKDFGERRVTVLDSAGNVLFESDRSDTASMDNHMDREEIASAAAGTPRVVKRYSKTFRCDMYYYALKVEGSEPFYLRVAERASDLWSYVGRSVPFVLAAMILALALSYALVRGLSGSVERQMISIRDGLRSINEGVYKPVVPEGKDAENLAILYEMNDLFYKISENYAAAQGARAKLDYVLNHVKQGIAAVDGEERIVFVNRAATELFCRAEAGQDLVFLLDDKPLYDKIRGLARARTAEVFECRSRGRDLVVDVSVTSDAALAKEIATVILVSDVSKEKAADRQRSEFFANASHELKTPLTSIQGLSELMLAKTPEDAPDRRHLERIFTESKRLNSIVLDMLYISGLESRAAAQTERVDLKKLAIEIGQEYRAEMEKKGLSFEVRGKGAVTADVRNMYECVGNLIGNAVHYNKSGGSVRVDISAREGTVEIAVADTGIGVAAEHLPHLAERFYRVDKSRSKKTGGTGLGLSIVKHVVALYGGTMRIESELGAGTTVTVRLPSGEVNQREGM